MSSVHSSHNPPPIHPAQDRPEEALSKNVKSCSCGRIMSIITVAAGLGTSLCAGAALAITTFAQEILATEFAFLVDAAASLSVYNWMIIGGVGIVVALIGLGILSQIKVQTAAEERSRGPGGRVSNPGALTTTVATTTTTTTTAASSAATTTSTTTTAAVTTPTVSGASPAAQGGERASSSTANTMTAAAAMVASNPATSPLTTTASSTAIASGATSSSASVTSPTATTTLSTSAPVSSPALAPSASSKTSSSTAALQTAWSRVRSMLPEQGLVHKITGTPWAKWKTIEDASVDGSS